MSTEGRHALIRLSQLLQTLQHSPDIWSLLAHYLFIEASHIRNLLASPESKQRNTILADYDRLLQLARHFDQQQIAHARRRLQATNEPNQDSSLLPPLEERIKGFLEYLTLLVLLRQDGGNRQGNNENNGEHADIIRVMTVHASKGLEFPIVYMPELVQQRFPFRSMPNPVPSPRGMLPEASTGENAHETSEACLFYVGITRARDHLILTSSERYGKKAYKCSPYLDALEAGIPAERVSKLRWDHPIASATPPPPTDAINREGPTSHAINCQDGHTINRATDAYQPSVDFINAMRPSTLSSSAIEAYQRCPRQYVYDSIYHFSGDPTGYQLFRMAIRKTVEELRKRCQRKSVLASQIPPTYQHNRRSSNFTLTIGKS